MKKTFPAVSSFLSRKDWERVCWKIFIKSAETFEFLITANERHDFIIRAVTVNRIHSGESYRQIAKELWLSPQTISNIKKAAQENIYRSYHERGKTERKKKLYSHTPTRPRIIHPGKPVRTKYKKIYSPL